MKITKIFDPDQLIQTNGLNPCKEILILGKPVEIKLMENFSVTINFPTPANLTGYWEKDPNTGNPMFMSDSP